MMLSHLLPFLSVWPTSSYLPTYIQCSWINSFNFWRLQKTHPPWGILLSQLNVKISLKKTKDTQCDISLIDILSPFLFKSWNILAKFSLSILGWNIFKGCGNLKANSFNYWICFFAIFCLPTNTSLVLPGIITCAVFS